MQPVAQALVGMATQGFKFNDVSWPFGAALFVVGLLPATPMFEQIELGFRRFAHRAAGIPEGFFTSITLLEQSKLRDSILQNKEQYSVEIGRYNKIKNIAVATGVSTSNPDYIAQADLFLSLFYGWALSQQAQTIWSAEVRSVFSDVTKLVSGRVTRLWEEVDQLIKVSLKSRYLNSLRQELGVDALEDEIDPTRIRDSKAYEDEDSRRDLFDRWETKFNDIAIAEKQALAIFVMLAANDDRPHSTDQYFAEAVRLAWREQSKPLYNTSITAVLGGFLAALVVNCVVATWFNLSGGSGVAKALQEGVHSGALTAANMAIQFITAMVVAFALYYSRDLPSRHRTNIPVSEGFSILVYSCISVVAVSLIVLVLYELSIGELLTFIGDPTLRDFMVFSISWSLVPGVFAAGCTVLAYLATRDGVSTVHLAALVLLTLVTAFVLLILGRHDLTGAYFWTAMASVLALTSVAALLFGYGAASAGASGSKPQEKDQVTRVAEPPGL
jgi:hypothetical protein